MSHSQRWLWFACALGFAFRRPSHCVGQMWIGSGQGSLSVQQHVDECKTEASAKTFMLADDLLVRLKAWKQASQFGVADDWVFASPVQIGRLPYSYTGVRQELTRASGAAGIGHVSTHAFRHTYRSWLDAVRTPISVQQKMIRHTDIRTTMNIYGDVVTDEMSTASNKVAELAFRGNGAQNGARIPLTRPSQ
jgi:integrase